MPADLKTSLNVLRACSQSSCDWATQSMNRESRCWGFLDGFPSLSHSTSVSVIMRVLPDPVGTAISLRLTSLEPSIWVPSRMPRTNLPVEYW